MKRSIFFFASLFLWTCYVSAQFQGWNILSNNLSNARKVIERSKDYGINHLQLSHELIMDLKQMRDSNRRNVVNELISEAHKNGIKEVVVWDHALYSLSYYPDKFRTGPNATIDLDNDEFWIWLKQDYRDMLSLIPEVDGIVLTFIETGARAEKQYSLKHPSNKEKLALVINKVAEVVCDELGKKLYIRTFAYNEMEYKDLTGCLSYIKNKDIILMIKETPHDFFLTHPNNTLAGKFDYRTIIEFDAGNEFNGQGIIANTWPQHFMRRWSYFKDIPNVIGYVARTDRYNTTHIVDSPNEILLYALMRYSNDSTVAVDEIYDEFITQRYGTKALKPIKRAFQSAYDIVTSSLYTLGTNFACHSALEYEPYQSSYNRHVSGKWINPPIVFVKHDVNKIFHYWQDIIQHLSPARYKTANSRLKVEYPAALENGWVTSTEEISKEYIQYVYKEKQYGVDKALSALSDIVKVKKVLSAPLYEELYDMFERTLLTCQLHKAVFTSILTYRLYVKNGYELDKKSQSLLNKCLSEILSLCQTIDAYSKKYPKGQWDWKKDTTMAMEYYNKITKTGWKPYGKVYPFAQ